MAEHFRAFVVVLLLSMLARPFVAKAFNPVFRGGARELASAWIVVTTFAFLSQSFWIYALAAAFFLRYRTRGGAGINLCTLYCLLIFSVPPVGPKVPAFGGINFLFELTNPRFLCLILLCPAIAMHSGNSRDRIGRKPGDIYFIALLLLLCVLQSRGETPTNSLRKIFHLALDLAIPYYAFSRIPKSTSDFISIMGAFCLGVTFSSLMAIFEFAYGWNLYFALVSVLGGEWALAPYMVRDGMLRASASTGQAIVLGYVAAVSLGFWVFVSRSISDVYQRRLVFFTLLGGLVSSLSRGPWVGYALILISYAAFVRSGLPKLLKRTLLLLPVLLLATLSPQGERITNLLPFVGNVDSENVTYRKKLFDVSVSVIEKNFWLGSESYMADPDMQILVQGQGIIDIVNTYIATALSSGFLGLIIFVALLGGNALAALIAAKKETLDDERASLGKSLAATVFGIMLMIVSVSSISFIPIVYWMVAALCAAYASADRAQGSAIFGTSPR